MALDAETRDQLIDTVRRFVTERLRPLEAQVAETDAMPDDAELRYQRGPDRYTLRVATSGGWAGTCRQLSLGLVDGSTHPVRFSFR